MDEKCPCCGELNQELPQNAFWVCGRCQFMCDKKHFSRIAAAVELAESTVEFAAKVSPVLMRHRYAHDRVIEIFGGE